MTATFLSERTVGTFGCIQPFLYAVSIMYSSFWLIVTESPSLPFKHAFSQRAGQTRPVNSGNGFVFNNLDKARKSLPL